MCLSTVSKVIKNPTNEEHVGYKVMFLREEHQLPAPVYYMPNGNSCIEINQTLLMNEWLTAKSVKKFANNKQTYMTGFHIFTAIKDAITWRHASHVIEVKYRYVTYHGTENRGQIVHIAREMYVPWPQVPLKVLEF